MHYVKESDARAAARRAIAAKAYMSADRILKDQKDPIVQRYNIFLSHSIHDAELVLGAKQLLEEKGLTVYVDWIDDPVLDRANVTPATARALRLRMQHCGSLFYLYSKYATQSRWMPWELGYFDGHNGNVAVFPLIKDWESSFVGEEFVGLYPCVEIDNLGRKEDGNVWLHQSAGKLMSYRRWSVGERTW